jgi:hypothetical protein
MGVSLIQGYVLAKASFEALTVPAAPCDQVFAVA